MCKRKPLSVSMAVALGVFSASSMLANSVYAQTDGDQADDELLLEEVIVTGSRIARTMDTNSQEIITFTAQDMQLAGDISVTDAMRSSTMNSIGSFRESSGSSAQSNATLNLRGVGSSRTLVLLNGRRTVGSPSLNGGGIVNLNMIPFAAVDRIEVVADGASAVYGSDAIAGVVNVILEKNYDGMTVSTRYGDRSMDDGTEFTASVLMGHSSDRGNITFGLEYDKRDPIFDADRAWTKASWSDVDGDGDIEAYTPDTVGVSGFGYTLINPTYDPDKPFDENDQTTWYLSPGAGCNEENGFAGVQKADGFWGGVDVGYMCAYAYGLVSANRAGLERLNNWVSAQYELTDDIDFYTDVLFAQNKSFGRYAPPAASGPTIPGDPRNDVGATFGYFRWTDIGTRDNVVTDTLTDVNVGVTGDTDSSISWEAYYTYSAYTSSSLGNYYLSYAGLAYNVAYEIEDMDTFVANLKSTTINDDTQELWKVFGGMQFDMFEMNGGTAAGYVGLEYFEIDYQALVDGQSEAGLVGGSSGNSATGFRDVSAFSSEFIFPITEWFELDAALRYDKYSDFGSAWSPRIGGIIEIPSYPQLRFKGSWGQGFRAPDLSNLYGATAFSADTATDFWGCAQNGISQEDCGSKQHETYRGSNPDLDAETSESWSLGADWSFADNWQATINYFNLTIDDGIGLSGAQDQLDIDFAMQGGNPNVVRNASGGVKEIYAGWQNATQALNFQSVDMGLNGAYDTGWGSFGLNLNATYYLKYEQEITRGGDIGDYAGTYVNGSFGVPEWKTNVLVPWNLGDWFASFNWTYTGPQKQFSGDGIDRSGRYGSFSLFNLQAGYSFEKFGTFTVGANNVTNEWPILDNNGSNADENLYPNMGRVLFVRWSIEL